MKLCFPFIAQLHQTFHSLPIAMEVARRHPDAKVHLACATPAHLDFVRNLAQTYYPDTRVTYDLLSLPRVTRVRQGIAPKLLALFWNIGYFRGFDALVVPERTTLLIRHFLPRRTRLIWTRHGAGDRASGFEKEIARFDFVLMAGDKLERRLLDKHLIRPGHYASGVYAKFDLVRKMQRPRLFDNDRPTIVYNPHFWRNLSSWPKMGRQVLDFFAANDRYNLVFAPHIRLFHPPTPDKYEAFRDYIGLPNIRIDLGSQASADMTYTLGADLYLGDVSSQVAEFLVHPRPCVFLNAHHVAWREDENYRFWHLGPVIDDVADLPAALDRAFADHASYLARQIDYERETFGPPDRETAPLGADAIVDFLHRDAAIAA